jgi:hypothetical protein
MKTNFLNEEIPQINEEYLNNLLNTDLNLLKKHQFADFFIKSKSNEYLKNVEYLKTEFKTILTENLDMKGLYILYDASYPIYVGISGKILNRIKQHFVSKTHNSASLAYLMSLSEYEKETNDKFSGERKYFPFEKYRSDIQKQMREKFKISIINIANDYELHLLEIIVAYKLKTFWNSFRTH